MECWSSESLLYAQPKREALFDTQRNVSEGYVSISTFKPSFGGMKLSRCILKGMQEMQVREAGSLSGSCLVRPLAARDESASPENCQTGTQVEGSKTSPLSQHFVCFRRFVLVLRAFSFWHM